MIRQLLFLALILLLSGPAATRTLHVGPGQSYSSIRRALDAAGTGDRIIVHAGTYQECPVVIDRSITLSGYGLPILDAQGEREGVIIEADSVTVEGFEIRHTGYSYIEDRAGIRVKRNKAFTIRNNRLILTFFGIYLEHARSGVVENNAILGKPLGEANSGNGIHLWYCSEVDIRNNLIRGHRDGIYFEFATDSRIRNNISEDNLRYGLHFMFSNDDIYTGNTFRENGAGVAVMFSRRIRMLHNLFHLNWGQAAYGLLLKEIYDAEIRNNTFLENTIGVYVEGSTRIRYRHNEFNRNGWALKMSGGCLDNIVNENNFLHNTFDLSLNSAPNNNSFDGNFWSDYNGYDLGRDGVGDVPYHPVKLFNYVVNRTPEAMVLLRSLFVSLLNFSEKVSPSLTPANVADNAPFM